MDLSLKVVKGGKISGAERKRCLENKASGEPTAVAIAMAIFLC